MVDGAIPGWWLWVLEEQQAKQVMGSKSVSSVPPWPLRQPLPPGSCSVPALTFISGEQ